MAYQPLLVILCQILLIHMYWKYIICFNWVLWYISHCKLYNVESYIYIYIYIYMILSGWVLWHINYCRLFKAKFSLCINIKYMIYKHILKWTWAHFSTQAAVVSKLLSGCTTWTLTKRLEKKLNGNYTRMLWAILNKFWQQHPTKHQLYGHLLPVTKNYTS